MNECIILGEIQSNRKVADKGSHAAHLSRCCPRKEGHPHPTPGMTVASSRFRQHLERKGGWAERVSRAGRRRRECKTQPRPWNPRSSNAPRYKFGAASERTIPAPVSQGPEATERPGRRATSSSAYPRQRSTRRNPSGPQE